MHTPLPLKGGPLISQKLPRHNTYIYIYIYIYKYICAYVYIAEYSELGLVSFKEMPKEITKFLRKKMLTNSNQLDESKRKNNERERWGSLSFHFYHEPPDNIRKWTHGTSIDDKNMKNKKMGWKLSCFYIQGILKKIEAQAVLTKTENNNKYNGHLSFFFFGWIFDIQEWYHITNLQTVVT